MDRIINRTDYSPPASGIRSMETDSRHKISGTGFQDALKSAMTSSAQALSDTPAVQGTLPPPRAMALGNLMEPAGVEMHIQDLIQTMEKFSAALMNPDQNFRELAPLADALGEEAEILFNKSPEKENPLQDFARRTALLARVEVEKFRRGDFL